MIISCDHDIQFLHDPLLMPILYGCTNRYKNFVEDICGPSSKASLWQNPARAPPKFLPKMPPMCCCNKWHFSVHARRGPPPFHDARLVLYPKWYNRENLTSNASLPDMADISLLPFLRMASMVKQWRTKEVSKQWFMMAAFLREAVSIGQLICARKVGGGG